MVATAVWGALIISLSVLLAVGGLIMVQRLVPLALRESHNAATGIIYGALYVMFGVMVDFSSYLVLNKYTASQNTVVSEAGDVVEIYQLAQQFPEPQQEKVQDLTRSYVQTVLDEEWPLMKEGQSSPRAKALASELGTSIQGFEPNTNAEQALYTQALERVHNLNQDRELRLLNVREGLPLILWVVIVTLGIIMVVFAYALGMENARLHRLTVAALAAGISCIILTIIALDHPFGGDFRVEPQAFEMTLKTIEGDGG